MAHFTISSGDLERNPALAFLICSAVISIFLRANCPNRRGLCACRWRVCLFSNQPEELFLPEFLPAWCSPGADKSRQTSGRSRSETLQSCSAPVLDRGIRCFAEIFYPVLPGLRQKNRAPPPAAGRSS